MNFQHPHGRVNYYVNGQMFENSPNKRDGREKAEKYCLENFIDVNSIIKFDSRTETKRYMFLLEKQKIGFISNLCHHFLFKIRDEETNAGGETFPTKTYCADFVYTDNATGQKVVEDVKGTEYFITDEFIDTKRDFDMTYKDKGLYIRIILLNKNGWYQWKIGDKKKSQTLIKKQREEIKQLRQEKHDREIADRKEEREIERLKELRAKGETLTSQQQKRLLELENKYML